MKKLVAPALTWAVLSVGVADASTLTPLNNLITFITSWGGDLVLAAIFGLGFMLLFAHEQFLAIIGHLSKTVVIGGIVLTAAAVMATLGLTAAGGAMLP
jgi:hypothetical protein